MFLDALAFHALSLELRAWLSGSFLQKIWQIDDDDFLLSFYRPPSRSTLECWPERDLRLRVSLIPTQPFMHPWLSQKPAAQVPSSFCMLIRKHCQGKPVLSCGYPHPEGRGLDKLLTLEFPEMVLLLELWDRRPNLLLLKKEGAKILGGHRLGRFERALLPGRPYQAPDLEQPDASRVTAAQLATLGGPFPLKELLLQRLFGLSPSSIQELLARSQLNGDELAQEQALERLTSVWENFWNDFWAGRVRPAIAAGKARLSCWGGPRDEAFETMLEAATQLGDSQQPESDQADHWLRSSRAPLAKSLQASLRKNRRRGEAIERDLSAIGQAETLQQQADLLLAHPHLQPQEGFFVVRDWSGQELRLPSEGTSGPSELAQKLYKQAGKLRRSRQHLEPRLRAMEQEREQLEGLLSQLNSVESPSQLEALRASLKSDAPQRATPSAAHKGPRRYAFGEFTLLLGRNPRQNDQLVTRLGKRDDLWFHVKEGGGAHVLLKAGGKTPTMEAIEAAATLAARHSARKNDSKVEVVFLPVTQVKKPAGSAPGYVIYHNEMTLIVDPQSSTTIMEIP